ncbi:MAG TPA: dehydrogenase, partial [Rhodospirillaceae bacterium]|nr:dehydrogenase [Rhodospirillaceae bacterium]
MTNYKIAMLDVWDEPVKDQTRDVAPDNFELLFADSYDDDHQIDINKQCDFIVCGAAPVSRRMLEESPDIQFIQKWGIGFDKVDLDAVRDHGLGLCNTAGANRTVVAEHTILLMLAVYRHLLEIDERLRSGEWLDIKKMLRNNALQMRGKTVGILGFGNIGRAVAQRLIGFETDVVYHDLVKADSETEKKLNARYVELDELFTSADILTIHTPLDDSTRDIVDGEAIGKMKKSAIIVNCARGGILNEQALHDAVTSGGIRGAGIDVWEPEPTDPENPLLKLDKVVVTPHAAGSAFDNVGNVSGHCFKNIQLFLQGEPMPEADVII